MGEDSELFRELAEQMDWLTINQEMKYLFGQWVKIPVGDEKKRFGGSLKSLEKARRNIESRGEKLNPRLRANFALLRIRYGKYVEEDS